MIIKPIQRKINPKAKENFFMQSFKCVIIFIILFYIFILRFFNFSFAAAVSPEQVQRSQEILDHDKILREKIDQGIKIFVEKILIIGADDLSKQQTDALILLYQKHWLNQNDVQDLLDAVRQLYVSNGHENNSFQINYSIKGSTLEIIIEKTQENILNKKEQADAKNSN